MKTYTFFLPVEASGSQEIEVAAKSREEAEVKLKDGGGKLVHQDFEVEGFDVEDAQLIEVDGKMVVQRGWEDAQLIEVKEK